MAQIDPPTDAIVGDWLSLPDVADRLGLPVSRVKQLLRDRKLLAVQRPGGEFAVPAGFIDGDQVIHGLGGTLTTGRVLNYLERGDDNRKLCSLYLSLLTRMGVNANRFGDATTPLAGL